MGRNRLSIIIFLIIAIVTLPKTLFAQLTYSKGDTVLIKQYLNKASQYNFYNPANYDSIFYYLNTSLLISQELNYENHLISIYSQYGHILNTTGNYSAALDHYFKLMEQLDNKIQGNEDDASLIEAYIRMHIAMGLIYFHMQDIDKSLLNFKQALEMSERNHNMSKPYLHSIIYTNIGSIYITDEDFLAAEKSFLEALKAAEKVENDKTTLIAKIYNNLGIVSKELNLYDRSFDYYHKAIEIYLENEDKGNLAQVYNNLAILYYTLNNKAKSIEIFKKALELSKESQNFNSEKLAINTLTRIYAENSDYKNAYLMSQEELASTRNSLEEENKKQIIHIENQYKYEKLVKQEKLEQQILLAEKEKRVLFSIIIIGILFFLCIILLLFYRHSQTKIKQGKLQSKNLELEKQNLELKNDELARNIESKNKELTTYVMYLSQKNSFITTIIDELKEVLTEPRINKQKVNNIVRQMKSNIDNTSWEEFEIRFQQVHQDFYTKLSELVPNITPNEKRLCAFLRLNMTTKEIASITFQSIKSIHVARTRLRKKMDIERDENLISFLQKL